MEPIVHYVFPVLLALAAGVPEAQALLFGLLTLVPDLDVFFSAHRVFTHSIFIPAVFFLAACLSKNSKTRQALSLAAFFLFSHVALDFFDRPVAVLYPLSSTAYGLDVSLTIFPGTLAPDFSVKVSSAKLEAPEAYELMTPQGVVFGILFLALLAANHIRRSKELKKSRRGA